MFKYRQITTILKLSFNYIKDIPKLFFMNHENIKLILFLRSFFRIKLKKVSIFNYNNKNQETAKSFIFKYCNKENLIETSNFFLGKLRKTPKKYDLLSKEKKVFLKKKLTEQVKKYKALKSDEKFILIEIGTFTGNSLILFGDLLNKLIPNKFIIYSIDPYEFKLSKKDIKKQDSLNVFFQKNIFHIYLIFKNLIFFKKWKKNLICLNDTSKNSIHYFLRYRIKSDFIFLDGSHHYKDVLEDVNMYKKILNNKPSYKAVICGDDAEFKYSELEKKYSKLFLKKFFKENLATDVSYLIYKDKKFLVHPGVIYALHQSGIKYEISKNIWYLKT